MSKAEVRRQESEGRRQKTGDGRQGAGFRIENNKN
jgi:hypothetical protein